MLWFVVVIVIITQVFQKTGLLEVTHFVPKNNIEVQTIVLVLNLAQMSKKEIICCMDHSHKQRNRTCLQFRNTNAQNIHFLTIS